MNKLNNYAKLKNKPVAVIERRGDIELIRIANDNNRYVLGAIDYIGGLEFDFVFIVGVDKGRVPAFQPNEGRAMAINYFGIYVNLLKSILAYSN